MVHFGEVELGRAVQRLEHLGVAVPVVGMRELDDLHVVEAHVVQHEHVQDPVVLGDAPPVVLERVQTLRQTDALALQMAHLEDADRLRPHQHAAAFVRRRRAQQPSAADVGLDVDRRIQAAEADQVVEVVDVVRVPVRSRAGCGSTE